MTTSRTSLKNVRNKANKIKQKLKKKKKEKKKSINDYQFLNNFNFIAFIVKNYLALILFTASSFSLAYSL